MLNLMEIMLFYLLLHILAVNSNEYNLEMREQGKMQYQLMKERELLPKYGHCWKSALDNLEPSCRHLSEETQSNMALHFTNCFLEMSGHETYNCELNKKQNLRKICISSMTDRAFNVYMEFYTHTQNICWYLHGQMWQEVIAENTMKFGQQLQQSAKQQEDLIEIQKSSIALQEKMLEKGQFLEQILDDVHISMITHKEVLTILAQSISSLQMWMVGKISWLDSVIFNTVMLLLVFMFTSTSRTKSARLPLITLIFINLLIERFITFLFSGSSSPEINTQKLYETLQISIWYTRYLVIFIAAAFIIYSIVSYKDVLQQNISLLKNIEKQNEEIIRRISRLQLESQTNDNVIEVINETIKGTGGKPRKKRDSKSANYTRESSVESAATSMSTLSSNSRYNLRSSTRRTPG